MRPEAGGRSRSPRAWLVPAAALGFLALFAWSGHWIVQRRESRLHPDRALEGAGPTAAAVARGKLLFWTRGQCHTCHVIGGRGHSTRGPALDEGDIGAAIGERALTRARERERQLGRAVDAADYLVESLIDPGAYLVEGYRNEMPPASDPPASLRPEDVRALVAYLQSVGGIADLSSIHVPEEAGSSGIEDPAAAGP